MTTGTHDDANAAADATRLCRSLAIELNNAGVALMTVERRDEDDNDNGDGSNGTAAAEASRVLAEAIRMMQLCLRRRRDPDDDIDQCVNSVEIAEGTLAAAKARLDVVSSHAAADVESEGGSSSDRGTSTCCGPVELKQQVPDGSEDENADDRYQEGASLDALREDCAVVMHNLALSHQRNGSSYASQFKALSYFEMALLLLQDGSSRSARPNASSSCRRGPGARSGGATAPREGEQQQPDNRAALSRRLVVSSVSHSARIHGGMGNHAAAEEYGNELSRLLMMMSEEELVNLNGGDGDNAAAAA